MEFKNLRTEVNRVSGGIGGKDPVVVELRVWVKSNGSTYTPDFTAVEPLATFPSEGLLAQLMLLNG